MFFLSFEAGESKKLLNNIIFNFFWLDSSTFFNIRLEMVKKLF